MKSCGMGNNTRLCNFLLLLSTFILLSYVTQGSRTPGGLLSHWQRPSPTRGAPTLQSLKEGSKSEKSKRLMIGSTAPTCTYNECRGCKYRCSAEEVPVEGNDPTNSAYRFKCICHRF